MSACQPRSRDAVTSAMTSTILADRTSQMPNAQRTRWGLARNHFGSRRLLRRSLVGWPAFPPHRSPQVRLSAATSSHARPSTNMSRQFWESWSLGPDRPSPKHHGSGSAPLPGIRDPPGRGRDRRRRRTDASGARRRGLGRIRGPTAGQLSDRHRSACRVHVITTGAGYRLGVAMNARG